MSAPSDLPTPTAASAPGLLPAPVPLLIRSPSLSGDHAVSVDAGTSIAELKARLADELPLSTRADDMRVIFGGRVVADGEKVGGLGRGEGARVLHVVFRPGALLAKQTSTDNQAAALPKEAAVAAPAPPPAVPEPASELRQRHAAPASSAPIAPTATTSALYPYYYQPMMIKWVAAANSLVNLA